MNIILAIGIILGFIEVILIVISLYTLRDLIKGLSENKLEAFINELKYNQNVNILNGYENKVDLDYIIDRLEEIK